MTEMNCFACDDLVELVPEIATEGVNETMCTSLQNNTGLNPSLTVLHDNCEDLSDANDCLVGRMNNEVENFKWQDFFHRFIPNLYEFHKMLICDSCGIWKKIQDLYDKLIALTARVKKNEDDIADLDERVDNIDPGPLIEQIEELEDKVSGLCELVAQSTNPVLESYGTLTGDQYTVAAHQGGEIMEKNGSPLMVSLPTPPGDGHWNMVGLRYSKSTIVNCQGATKTYEWILPYIQDYTFSNDIAYGDVIWQVHRNVAINQWGFTSSLVDWLRDWPQWWDGYGSSFGIRNECSIKVEVVNDYIQLSMIGSMASMAGVTISGGTIAPLVHVS